MNIKDGKVFFGMVEAKETQYGVFHKVGVTAEDLRTLADNFANERGWVNFDIKETREGDKYFQVNLHGLDVDLDNLSSGEVAPLDDNGAGF